ncbi:Methyl-CpG-binding domain protein [Melia azedarach]|uniref:Methyl-CpG-binding domain protein n=1 Tax=Melia azedarach TaxID=155640 RepID=A0ACC1Y9Q2_MELAZ|nr:Methyl-CpG-binding domain protein [Melia azedarach]
MEQREQSNEQADNSNGGRTIISPATRATLARLKDRRRGRFLSPGVRTAIYDNSSYSYRWLLPGWVAEERHVASGRIYRYYYDPDGRLYRSRHEVFHAWDESGLVFLD